jgi:hypothetical protein
VGAVTDEGVDSINNETRHTPSSMPGGRLDTKVLTIDIQSQGGLYVVNPLSFTLSCDHHNSLRREAALFLLNLIH